MANIVFVDNPKTSLYEAQERASFAESNLKAANKAYLENIRFSENAEARQQAYQTLVQARKDETKAKKELITLQETTGQITDDPVDIYEFADRAVNAEFKKTGEKRQGTITALAHVRQSLTMKSENQANLERVTAFAEVHEHTLKDDRGLFLFGDACEQAARAFVDSIDDKQTYPLKKQIAGLRESLKSADEFMKPKIEAELAEKLYEHDKRLEDTTVQIMKEQSLLEVAQLFSRDRAKYIERKNAGRKALFAGSV